MGLEKEPLCADCLIDAGMGCPYYCLFFKEDYSGSVLLEGK